MRFDRQVLNSSSMIVCLVIYYGCTHHIAIGLRWGLGSRRARGWGIGGVTTSFFDVASRLVSARERQLTDTRVVEGVGGGERPCGR
jgi:hypothetical protein